MLLAQSVQTLEPRPGSPREPDRETSCVAAEDRLQILVVEDDDADAYLIQRALAANPRVGEVIHARDGVEALDAIDLAKITPDIAFIDLRMPKKDGFALLLDLAAREDAEFPVVILTSSRHGADALRVRKRGAERFITKPNTIERLTETLNAVIADFTTDAGVADSEPKRDRTTQLKPGAFRPSRAG